jgi:hypothetical protein
MGANATTNITRLTMITTTSPSAYNLDYIQQVIAKHGVNALTPAQLQVLESNQPASQRITPSASAPSLFANRIATRGSTPSVGTTQVLSSLINMIPGVSQVESARKVAEPIINMVEKLPVVGGVVKSIKKLFFGL